MELIEESAKALEKLEDIKTVQANKTIDDLRAAELRARGVSLDTGLANITPKQRFLATVKRIMLDRDTKKSFASVVEVALLQRSRESRRSFAADDVAPWNSGHHPMTANSSSSSLLPNVVTKKRLPKEDRPKPMWNASPSKKKLEAINAIGKKSLP